MIDCISNVVYNYRIPATFGDPNTEDGTRLHFIGNLYLVGPDTPSPAEPILITTASGYGSSRVYVFGNIGYTRVSDRAPEQWENITELDASARSFEFFSNIVVNAQDVDFVYDLVLAEVGPWPRDEADERIIGEVEDPPEEGIKNGRLNQAVIYPEGVHVLASTSNTVTITVPTTLIEDKWGGDTFEIVGGDGYPQDFSNTKTISSNTPGNEPMKEGTSTITIEETFSPPLYGEGNPGDPSNTEWQIAQVPPPPFSGDYPTLDEGTPQADADDDGIPDVWENFLGSNPQDDTDALDDEDGDGYKNVEEYAHFVLELLVKGLPTEPRYLLR